MQAYSGLTEWLLSESHRFKTGYEPVQDTVPPSNDISVSPASRLVVPFRIHLLSRFPPKLYEPAFVRTSNMFG